MMGKPRARTLEAATNSTPKTREWRDYHKMRSVGTALTPEEYAIAEQLKAHYGSISTMIRSLVVHAGSLDVLPPIVPQSNVRRKPRQSSKGSKDDAVESDDLAS